jgi:hypothetical protein
VLEKTHPGISESSDHLNNIADGVRNAIALASKGGKDSISRKQFAALYDVLGQDTVDVLNAAYKVLGGTDPAERESFAAAVLAADEGHAKGKDLIDKMQGALLDPKSRADLPAIAEHLVQYAAGRYDSTIGPNEAKLTHKQVVDAMTPLFGAKTGAILDAAEKQAKQNAPRTSMDKDKVATDEEGNVLDKSDPASKLSEVDGSRQIETIYYGRKTGDKYEGVVPKTSLTEEKGQAKQAFERATKEQPGKNVEIGTANTSRRSSSSPPSSSTTTPTRIRTRCPTRSTPPWPRPRKNTAWWWPRVPGRT